MNILYITNIPSPYVVEFLNCLGEKTSVHAVFERAASRERNDSWKEFEARNFSCTILNGINYDVDKAFCVSVIREIKKHRHDRIIISNPLTATGMIAILYMRMKRIPYALQVEGGFPKDGCGVKETVKTFFVSNATHYYSSGKMTDDYLLAYGAKISKITRFPFTSISEKDIVCLNNESRRLIRYELGLDDSFIMLSVGSIIPRKGYDILLRALAECDRAIKVYIIGGMANQELKELMCEYHLDNVHFIEFRKRKEILKWMQAADFFVMPTRYDIWGLVVNEALSQGLGVISSDKCIAALEMITDGQNGFFFESENVHQLAEKITLVYEQRSHLETYREQATAIAHLFTYEKMAEAHLSAWGD